MSAPRGGGLCRRTRTLYGSASDGVYAHLGVKNLTNADICYPEQEASFAGMPLSYLEDYPRPGRRWWLSVGYAF